MPTPGVSGADVPFPSSEAFIFASFIPFDGMAALRALSATIRPDPRGLRNLRDYPDHVQQNKPRSKKQTIPLFEIWHQLSITHWNFKLTLRNLAG
jgi:hypothetical protein